MKKILLAVPNEAVLLRINIIHLYIKRSFVNHKQEQFFQNLHVVQNHVLMEENVKMLVAPSRVTVVLDIKGNDVRI